MSKKIDEQESEHLKLLDENDRLRNEIIALKEQNLGMRGALELCLPILTSMDTLRGVCSSFPALDKTIKVLNQQQIDRHGLWQSK